MFKKKKKEINSDLFYKVRLEDRSDFSFTRNGGITKTNKRCMNLKPGDWVTIDHKSKAEMEFKSRSLLNWMYMFYAKRKTFFNFLFQLSMIVIYVIIYAFLLVEFSEKDKSEFDGFFRNLTWAKLVADIVLLAPLLLIFFKLSRTIYRSVVIWGPSRKLKNKFSDVEGMKFTNLNKKKRTIVFDKNGNPINIPLENYHYREVTKITEEIFRFDLIIVSNEKIPLFNVEYYTIQLDFKQLEGVIMTKSKKLEYDKIELVI